MSAANSLAAALLAAPRFTEQYGRAAVRRVAADLLKLAPQPEDEPDWSYLLSCASVFALADTESALDAALRIMETALAAEETTSAHRAAAALLLDRVGNRPVLRLARERGLVEQEEDLSAYPPPLRLDVVRSRLALAVPTPGGGSMAVSRFQRDMWTAVGAADWVSASAPTSAGKSRVVRLWFRELVDRALAREGGPPVRLVAVVPTRALVEEVTRELREDLPSGVQLTSLPWDARAGTAPVEVFVLTQERLHLLQQRFPLLTTDLLFVDEAHKFGDGARGVLLQQVLDEAVRRSPAGQIVFAAPLAEDPEVLLNGAPPDAQRATVDSNAVTVTQNLLYANQVRNHPLRWNLDLLLADDTRRVGEFTLANRATPRGKRLPFVAVALAGSSSGNLIYADGAAAAEEAASLIADALGEEADVSADADIAALIELIESTVSSRYALARVLRRGVAFHYGNMPQLVRTSVEGLFRQEKIRFLVCTSTLLEGVNLPCTSLFVRGPHRGTGKPMNASDFWNLAGRAGRWGMELEGNVVCVDTDEPGRWAELPRRRVRQKLRRETAAVLANPGSLAAWIEAGAPAAGASPETEAVFSFLAAKVAQGLDLAQVPGLELSAEGLVIIGQAVSSSLAQVSFPSALIERHAGINPLAIQRLLTAMQDSDSASLLVTLPEQPDAWSSYAAAFGLLQATAGADFGGVRRQNQLAVLVVSWMRGMPLAQLIAGRLTFEAGRPKPKAVATTIREVMSDVENVARFRAPKYLSCYVDLLRHHLAAVGREDLQEALPSDIDMYLELGVSTTTELSLLSLGLSRTSTIEVFAQIADDALTPAGCLVWLGNHDLATLGLAELVRREVQEVLQRQARPA